MIDRHETRFVLQMVRNQTGRRVYPLHRLDKQTSCVLLFGFSSDVARHVGQQFADGSVQKRYIAVVRGHTPLEGIINHPLKEELDKVSDKKAQQNKAPQKAITAYKRLACVELPIAIDRYPQSWYSLVEIFPETGRKHQIRRHFKHIAHPIIGDAKHGKGIHNRYFSKHFQAKRLLRTCTHISIIHPITGFPLNIYAPLDDTFIELFKRFGWSNHQELTALTL